MSLFKKLKTLVVIVVLFALLSAYYFYDNSPSVGVHATAISDGPYVFDSSKGLSAWWLCNGEVEKEQLQSHAFPLQLNYCDLTATVFAKHSTEHKQLMFNGDFRIAALSDFHGQYELMKTLLTNNAVIDGAGNWAFGNGHVVITGDVFDRGEKVTEILWFLYQLEQQAQKVNGKVHLLLGNHEVMVLNGDLRYLHEKYVKGSQLLATSYQDLYSKQSILGRWLRSKPVLVKINNMLFTHGGFHPSLAQQKRSLNDINQVFKSSLIKAELAKPRTGFAQYLHKADGPIWYRGYFKDDGASEEEIDLLLQHFAVDHLVVGHTSQKQVLTRHQGKVIAIDSSIKKGKYGEILFVDGDKKWRGSLSGERLALQ